MRLSEFIWAVLEFYDLWILTKVVGGLVWIEEWLSISQKRVELFILGVCVGLEIVWLRPTYLRMVRSPSAITISIAVLCIIAAITMSFAQWLFRLLGSRTRARICFTKRMLAFRLYWQIAIILMFIPEVNPRGVCWYTIVALYYYVCALSVEGDSGSRRKKAWTKIKGFFSPGSQPIPQEAS